jgi:hypothetical protein
MDNTAVQNTIEYDMINSNINISTVSLRHIIKRVYQACKAKGLDTFDGLPIHLWYTTTDAKVGQEPMMRIMFRLAFAMVSQNLFLVEVLNEEPELMIACFNNGDLTPFYAKYQQGIQQ